MKKFIQKISQQMALNENIRDIECINFGILSAEDIIGMSVCEINSTKNRGTGTVYDRRLGYTADTNEFCLTCNEQEMCPGHFGYTTFAEPMLHPLHHKIVVKLLTIFCKNSECSRLLLAEQEMEYMGLFRLEKEERFNKITTKDKKFKICIHCGYPQPKITKNKKDGSIVMEHKKTKTEKKADRKKNPDGTYSEKNNISVILTTQDIKGVFDNISDEDLRLIGFDPKNNHPRDLILTVFPIIPPCARPYVLAEGHVCDDDLTYQIIEIIKLNNQLKGVGTRQKKELTETKRIKVLQSLKFRLQTFYDNSKGKAKHPTDSRPIKGLKERLSGKYGQMRHNHMGKRVNFSARTVIGSEPTLELGQLGIPYHVARIHTKPEIVTAFNIKWLTDIVNNGKANFVIRNDTKKTRFNLKYTSKRRGTQLLYGDKIIRTKNGAAANMLTEDKDGKIIYPPDSFVLPIINGNEQLKPGDALVRNGEIFDVKYPTKRHIKLNYGDIVERHLQNNDVLLLNRQPTLHRGSMLAVKAVLLPYKTFRMNLAICKSLNADK